MKFDHQGTLLINRKHVTERANISLAIEFEKRDKNITQRRDFNQKRMTGFLENQLSDNYLYILYSGIDYDQGMNIDVYDVTNLEYDYSFSFNGYYADSFCVSKNEEFAVAVLYSLSEINDEPRIVLYRLQEGK